MMLVLGSGGRYTQISKGHTGAHGELPPLSMAINRVGIDLSNKRGKSSTEKELSVELSLHMLLF